jgi:hypothetical protein
MPKDTKYLKNNELTHPDLLRAERIYLTSTTYEQLLNLAKAKAQALELDQPVNEISHKKATEMALLWAKSGQFDAKTAQKLHNIALFNAPDVLHQACLVAFLAVNPSIKVRKASLEGRPRGYIPYSKRLKIAMGEVISELLASQNRHIRKLKAA